MSNFDLNRYEALRFFMQLGPATPKTDIDRLWGVYVETIGQIYELAASEAVNPQDLTDPDRVTVHLNPAKAPGASVLPLHTYQAAAGAAAAFLEFEGYRPRYTA